MWAVWIVAVGAFVTTLLSLIIARWGQYCRAEVHTAVLALLFMLSFMMLIIFSHVVKYSREVTDLDTPPPAP